MKRRYFIGIAVLVAIALALVASFRTFVPGPEPHTHEGPASHPRLFIYDGETTLLERIATTGVIARVRFQSVSAGALEEEGEFVPAMVFSFQALEYLKGSGDTEIQAVTTDLTEEVATRAEAEAEARAWLAERDTRWDDREAIVFLWTIQEGRYWLGAHSFYGEDAYTIASRHSKRWLPEAQTGSRARSSGSQRFLLNLETPPTGSATASSGVAGETIALSALKAKIADIAAEVAAGDGSDEYRDCVAYKYWWERTVAHHLGQGGSYNFDPYEHSMDSGLATGTQVYQGPFASSLVRDFGEIQARYCTEFWLEGNDADLFEVRYPGRVYTSRPLPAGQYETYYNDRAARYIICDAYPEAERTRHRHIVTATAPTAVLHEAFFDPVTLRQAQGERSPVGADATNGALEPASFTDANSASATLQSLSYEPPADSGDGTVKLRVDPHTGLVGHRLDFIELDGSVSLSLRVADATVDSASKTLSWSVASQPWDDGDKLMLRIRKALPAPGGLSVSPVRRYVHDLMERGDRRGPVPGWGTALAAPRASGVTWTRRRGRARRSVRRAELRAGRPTSSAFSRGGTVRPTPPRGVVLPRQYRTRRERATVRPCSLPTPSPSRSLRMRPHGLMCMWWARCRRPTLTRETS